MKYKTFLAMLAAAGAMVDPVQRAASIAHLKTVGKSGTVLDDETNAPLTLEITDPAEQAPAATQQPQQQQQQAAATTTAPAAATPAAATTQTPAATSQAAGAAANAPVVPAAQLATVPAHQPGAAGNEDGDARVRQIVQQTLAAAAVHNVPAVATRGLSVAIQRTHAAVTNGNTGAQFVIPKGVQRSRVKNFKGTVDGRGPEERAYRFGMWALATLSRSMPGKFSFKDAENFVQEQRLHRENDNGSGGYAVPTEFGTDLIDLREIYGRARSLLKTVVMTSDKRTDPRRKSGLQAYFIGEAQPGIESTKSWNQVELIAKTLMVISRYTAQLNADAVINIGDDLASEIAYAFSLTEDSCAFNGDGTSPFGGIVGIRTAIVGTAGVKVVTANSWGSIALADFNAVVGLLPQYADTGDAVWLCHRGFYAGVMQKLELAAGGNTVMEVRTGSRGPRPLFLGYPVEFSQVFPSTSALSQIPVILGDLTKAATFGDRQQEEISFSQEATVGGQSLWERNEIGIRGTERFDINVHDVGDASTIGPVVALQTAAA